MLLVQSIIILKIRTVIQLFHSDYFAIHSNIFQTKLSSLQNDFSSLSFGRNHDSDSGFEADTALGILEATNNSIVSNKTNIETFFPLQDVVEVDDEQSQQNVAAKNAKKKRYRKNKKTKCYTEIIKRPNS